MLESDQVRMCEPYAILAIGHPIREGITDLFFPHPPLPGFLAPPCRSRTDKRSLRENFCAVRERTALSFLTVRSFSLGGSLDLQRRERTDERSLREDLCAARERTTLFVLTVRPFPLQGRSRPLTVPTFREVGQGLGSFGEIKGSHET